MKVDREIVRRALPRVLITLFLLSLVGASLLATPTASADTAADVDDDGCPMSCHGGHGCGPHQTWDTEAKMCIPGEQIDCGKDPTVFNLYGGHWQRLFNEFCAPYTPYADLEVKCHDMTCEECKAQVYPALNCTYKP